RVVATPKHVPQEFAWDPRPAHEAGVPSLARRGLVGPRNVRLPAFGQTHLDRNYNWAKRHEFAGAVVAARRRSRTHGATLVIPVRRRKRVSARASPAPPVRQSQVSRGPMEAPQGASTCRRCDHAFRVAEEIKAVAQRDPAAGLRGYGAMPVQD